MEDRLPLAGKKILVTRSEKQADSLSSKIKDAGGVPIVLPLIQIKKIPNNLSFYLALQKLDSYDWLILTSKNSARYFLKEMEQQGINVEILNEKKIAVVGKKTADYLQNNHIQVDLVPEEFVAESLLEKLLQVTIPGERVLFPKGNLARNIIETGLTQAGMKVDSIVIYETILNKKVKAPLLNYLENKELDIVTFTSPSTVNSFFELLPSNRKELLKGISFACIGPISVQAIEKHGRNANITATEYTIDGLVQEIVHFYREVYK